MAERRTQSIDECRHLERNAGKFKEASNSHLPRRIFHGKLGAEPLPLGVGETAADVGEHLFHL
jgi:hypothetical protein